MLAEHDSRTISSREKKSSKGTAGENIFLYEHVFRLQEKISSSINTYSDCRRK
jgi:hypothetical protein